MRKVHSIRVDAAWDSDAGVWVAMSDDVPGLVTEAPTVEALISKLKVMVPELLEANGIADEEFDFLLCSEYRQERLRMNA